MNKINAYSKGLTGLLTLFFALHLSAQISPRVNPVISGYVYLMPDSAEFDNVTLNFSGIGQAVTDDNGYYEMEVPLGWDGIVTPSVCDGGFYAFDPPTETYLDVNSDMSGQDYLSATDTVFTISGTITEKNTGEPLANTQVVFGKETGGPPWNISVITNDSGQYSYEVPPCWNNIVNPGVMDGYFYLEPFSREYDGISGSLENEDYTFVNYEYPVPPGWDYTQTGDVHIIAIENTSSPNLCGIPLELGDLIGVFYYDENNELKCGGFGRWQDEHNVALIAQGDDDLTQVKEGFGYYEVMNWRAYSYAMDEEFMVTPEFKTGGFLSSNNKFIPGGLSIVQEVDAYYSNLITIPAGWSGLSSYTSPNVQPLITKVMEPILDQLVILQDMQKMYYPAGGINNMFVWTFNKGYKIKVSGEAFLPMHGCQDPNTTVNLVPTWNLLPVLSQCTVNTETLFSPVISKLIMVKDIAGTGIYWPGFGVNTLPVLKPGRAYYVAVSQNTSVTYGECETAKNQAVSENVIMPNHTPWETPVESGSGHSLLITHEALTGLGPGDYIGAFDEDGKCFGLTMIENIDGSLPLTAFGDDTMTDGKDGFFEGERMVLKVFQTENDEIISAIAGFDQSYPQADGTYTDNGISVIRSLKWTPAGMVESAADICMFPNPSTGIVTFSNPSPIYGSIMISTLDGNEVFKAKMNAELQADLSGLSPGIYLVRMSGDDFNVVRKLVLE